MKKNKKKLFYIILFIILVVICFMFPYTHDDWPWSGAEGLNRLKNLFDGYNGRWAGNILVMILTRFRIFRAIFIASTLLGIIYFIKKLTKTTETGTLLSIFLLLCMPISMLAQAIAWTSGFANYVPPVLLILIYIYLNRNIFYKEKVEINNKLIIPLLIMGFINSLFIEHMTIYNCLLALTIVIYQLVKKEHNLANIFYLIGAISGAILMFTNTAYTAIATGEDTYRTIEQSNIITNAFNTYFSDYYKYFIHNNTVLNIVLCILVLYAVYRFYKYQKESLNKVKDIFLKIATTGIIGYLTYIIYQRIMSGGNIFILDNYKLYLEGIIMLIFALSLLIISLIICVSKARQKRMIFELISIFIIAGPLLVVTPIGPRCFFPTYVFFILLCIEWLNEITKRKELLNLNNALKLIVLLLFICNLSIYRYTYKIDTLREEHIKKHLNDTKIVLPKIPYANYLWAPNPVSFEESFKEYYHIDKTTELEFIDYKTWRKTEYKK